MADAISEAFVTLRPSTEGFSKEAEKGIKGSLGKLALGAGVAGAAIGAVALKFAGDFDTAYDTIRAGTGATGDVLKGLQGDFKEVLKDVPTDFATAGTAIADLNTRLGLTGEPLQEMSAQFINLARVTGGDVATSIAAGTRLFGDWSIATEDQAEALDRMFRASQATGIGVDDLMQQVVTFGAPLRQMGFSLDESAALLGKWEKEGVNAEAILGALKIGVANFAKEGIDGREGLERFVEQVTALGPGAEATSLAVETFGSRAGPDMAAAVLEGRFAIDDYLGAIEGGEDTINAVAADTDDWREKLTLLKNQGLVAMEPALMAVFDGLTRFVDLISTQVVPWIQEHLVPAFREYVLPVLSAVAGFITGTLSAAFDTFVSVILPRIQEFATGAGEQFAKFQGYYETDIKPALDNIRTAVETVVGAVVGFIAEHWPRIQQIIQPVLDQVQNYVETVFGVIREVFEIFIDLLGGDFSSAWENFKQLIGIVWNGIQETIENAIQIVKNVLSAAWDAIKATADAGWELIKQGMVAAWDFLKEKASELASWIGAKIGDIIQWFRDLPGLIWDAVIDIGSWLVEQGGALIDGLWTGIKEIWESVTGWFLEMPERIKNNLAGAATWLVDVGKAIINGLWNGMKDAWSNVTGWIGGLAGQIAGLKGPIEKDRKLLVNEGAAIMQGLGRGMEKGFDRFTAPTLREIEGTISSFLNGPMGSGIQGGSLIAKIEGRGGMMPGLGQPVPILAHAGETVLPTHRQQLEPLPMGEGVEVSFNGPVTIMARDREDAERGAQDVGWGVRQAIRARGLA